MVARLCTTLHLRPDEARDLSWPDVLDLLTYWSQWPPAHESLAVLARTAQPREQVKRLSTQEEIEQFNRMHG